MPGAAYLLSQVGVHSSRLWSERLEVLGVDPRQVLLLRHVAAEEGRSQQSLEKALQVPASRIVALVDGLEERGLVERRRNRKDRRVHALHLMPEGREILEKVMEISKEHEADLCVGLEAAEREQLVRLLNRIVAEQGLAPGGHPGLSERG
jgi:DNA-binding MarR family transcriptional regulator